MKIRWSYVGGAFLLLVILLSIFAENLTGFLYNFQNADALLLKPSFQHWFGTDSLGRDVFTRIFYGARVSLFIAIVSSVLTMGLGISVGLSAGWWEGRTGDFLIRAIDVLQSIPSFLSVSLLCLFFQSVLPGDFGTKALWSLTLGIALVHWFNVAKVARGQTRQLKVLSYVEAAKALGASDVRIFQTHLLPNMQGPLCILFVMQIPASIVYESMISFSGYGLQSPQVSWGILLQEGWRGLSQFPHLLLLPALVLFLTVLSFHLMLFQRGHLRSKAEKL
jgi:oligopeptide transport system permease protein